MVPPCSNRITRVPSYSRIRYKFTNTRLSLSMAGLSMPFLFFAPYHWASPLSLATTNGVSVDFLSSGYLDVSVPRVRFAHLCIQWTIHLKKCGLPHSEIFGSSAALAYPKLIAEFHVLLRLLTPRHPPDALLLLEFSLSREDKQKQILSDFLRFLVTRLLVITTAKPPLSVKDLIIFHHLFNLLKN